MILQAGADQYEERARGNMNARGTGRNRGNSGMFAPGSTVQPNLKIIVWAASLARANYEKENECIREHCCAT